MTSLYYCVFLFSFSVCNVKAKNVQLEQNGFNGITIYISPSVEQSSWTNLEKNIKEAFAEASTSVYYGSNSRAFFRNIQIVLPMSWDTSERSITFSSMNADIAVQNMPTSLYGDMPYTDQARTCRVEGDRINFPLSYFENLAETIERLGSIGSLIVKQWMGYRYGIFEEVGFPRDPVYPSAYCADAGGSPVAVSCSNVPLSDRGFASIRGSSFDTEDCKCNQAGPLDLCMYVLGQDQDLFLLSSIMGFSQIPSNLVFCDDEFYLHESQHPSIHNDLCEEMSTFGVVLQHYDFDFGHNDPNFVDDTAPTYEVVQQALKIRVVLDTKQDRDFGNHITSLVLDWVHREQAKGVDFGPNFIASGGAYWHIETLSMDEMTKIVYTPPSTSGSFSNLEWAMDTAIKDFDSSQSKDFPGYIILISDGSQTMGSMANAFSGTNHINVVAIDTNTQSNPNMEEISQVTTGGFYVHAGDNILEVSKALSALTSTLSYNAESDMAMLFSSQLNGSETSFSVPVDSSLESIQMSLFFKSSGILDASVSIAQNGRSLITTRAKSHTVVEHYEVGNENGEWTFSMKASEQFTVGIQILGRKKAAENWIKLDCEIRKTLVNNKNIGSRIIAKAFNEVKPIVKTRVIAVVEGIEIPLKDEGNVNGEPDAIAGDGVYTALLPEDKATSVECRMETTGDSFSHPGFETDNDGFSSTLRQPYCCGSLAPEPTTPEKIDNVARVAQSAFYKP